MTQAANERQPNTDREGGSSSDGGDDRGGRVERDFGDSAGYGTGGSTLDRHEVGDDEPITEHKQNPLDDVMKSPRTRSD